MRKCFFILLILAGLAPALRGQYRDHRIANPDSLENVIAGWTPERLATASYGERSQVAGAFRDLMWGYSVVNGERSLYMARRLVALAREENWLYSIYDAEKMIGQHFWAGGQPDSAAAHFRRSLEAVERMRAGETNAENPEGYDTVRVDDAYSSLCGAIGNLYNTMDSIPKAMEYYAKAGEIFEKYGWKQSSAVLYHNLGETKYEMIGAEYRLSDVEIRKKKDHRLQELFALCRALAPENRVSLGGEAIDLNA